MFFYKERLHFGMHLELVGVLRDSDVHAMWMI